MKDILVSASLAVLFQPHVWHQGVYYTVCVTPSVRKRKQFKQAVSIVAVSL